MLTWSTACRDWEARLLAGRSLVPDLPLFETEAARALRVFKRLRIPDVIGQPTMAEACGEWFLPIVAAMFGSYDPDRDVRMLQEFFLLIPKKNSKSSNGGAVMLTAVIMNRRPEAEFNLIAPTIQIANIAFKQAMGTIRLDPELSKLFHIQRHIRTITHRTTGAILQIKAADTDVITGGKPVGTMIDETHVFAKKSNAADIFVELRGALTARPDGFLFQTTTQSKEEPAGVFKTELANARAVRDGEMLLPLLPILYEYPDAMVKDGSWKDRRFWSLVNPNIGRSVNPEFLARELMKAEGPTGSAEQLLLIASQHFNVEIGLRLRADGWTGGTYWQAAADATLTLDELLARSEVVTIGIDGGGLDDLLGMAVLGRCRETKRWLLWNHAWAQDDVFKQRKEIVSRLNDFIQAGTLTLCEAPRAEQADGGGQTIDDPGQFSGTADFIAVADIVERVHQAGLLPPRRGVGFDPAGVGAMVDELAARGIETEENGGPVVGVTQGWKLSPAIWTAERKLKDGTLRHAGQEIMAWCVGNAKVEQRGNAVSITKQAAGKSKIDPLVATFNAVMLMSRNPDACGDVGDWLASIAA